MGEINKDTIHDEKRLQEIADLDLFSDDLKALVDELVEKGAKRLNLPYCSVSIVLDEAQFFLSLYGRPSEMIAESGGTPLEWSFCRNVARNQKEFVVGDSKHNVVMKDSPLARIDGIRCYLGVPMITSKGFVIGSFCAFGLEARVFGHEDLIYMRELSVEAIRRIESRVGRELIRRSQMMAKLS